MLFTIGKIRWFVNNSMSPPCLTRPPNCASLFNLIIRIMLRVSWRFSVALIVQLVRFAQGADFLLHFFSHVVVHCVQCELCAFVCKFVCKCAVCMEGVGAVFARPVIDALGLRQYKWVLTAVKLGCNQALSWDYMHSQMLGNPCTQADAHMPCMWAALVPEILFYNYIWEIRFCFYPKPTKFLFAIINIQMICDCLWTEP